MQPPSAAALRARARRAAGVTARFTPGKLALTDVASPAINTLRFSDAGG
jgi:hypothetical protein